MVPCPRCGYHNAEDAVKCINCGYELCNHETQPEKLAVQYDDTSKKPRERSYRNLKILFLLLFTILIIYFLTTLRNNSGKDMNTVKNDIFGIRTEKADTEKIIPNAGGIIPTEIPSNTPTPLVGMESPLFCKLEMVLLRNKAEKFGSSGMLLLDRYSQPEKTCYFTIRDKRMITEIGYINTIHNSENDFGIQAGISNKTGNEQSEYLLFWGTVSLAALDKNLSYDQAEFVIKQALANGISVYDMYDIAVKNDPLELSRVISIFRNVGNETAR